MQRHADQTICSHNRNLDAPPTYTVEPKNYGFLLFCLFVNKYGYFRFNVYENNSYPCVKKKVTSIV